MATPFKKYIEIKDNYCLSYFGEDKDTLIKVIQARDFIEKELKGIKVFIACKDQMKPIVHGKRNIILESKMGDFQGKMGSSTNLSGKDDLESLLKDSKIPIPENF